MSDVVLTVNKQQFDGWTYVRISRGIEQLCGSFDLGFTDRWSGRNEPWPIRMGDACSVSVDGQVVITGYIDDVSLDFDGSGFSMSCAGRDAAGDLVDCSAASKSWTGRTLPQIAADIVRPFGMSVKANAATGKPVRSFGIQPGETAFDAIERLCRFRGILPVSDGAGVLLLTGPGSARVKTALAEGENILAGSIVRSLRDRYSRYTVHGHDAGMDESTPDQNAGPSGTTTDPGVSRHRPLVLLSETPANAADLKQRAIWEAAVRRGRSIRARVSVQGWTHDGGIWTPNTLVKITSRWLGLDGWMLITAVSFARDDGGTRTDLELSMKEGFIPETITEAAS